MQRKKLIVALVALGVFLLAALTPRPAAAGSDTFTDPLLISAYVLGGVTVITLLAILLADREEPDFMRFTLPQRQAASRGSRFRLATACPPQGGNLPLACW